MGKLKTHKGVAKRFKITGRGKLIHGKGGRRHLLSSKPSRRTRAMRKPAVVLPVNEEKLRRLMPYA